MTVDARRPKVAIVGRPNVGKSTLFNRLIRKRRAITLDEPGVTRDPIAEDVTWNGVELTLVDTGGLGGEAVMDLADRVHEHTVRSVRDADLVVAVLDARAGLTAMDRDTVDLLSRLGVPVLYVANKADGPREHDALVDFCTLGIDVPLGVSAEHGGGLGDVRAAILERLRGSEHVRASGGGGGATDAEAGAADTTGSDASAAAAPASATRNDSGTDAGATAAPHDELAPRRRRAHRRAERRGDPPPQAKSRGDREPQGSAAADTSGAEALDVAEPEFLWGKRDNDVCRVAIVGRPNVGKSSLLNALAGRELSLVDPTPGTTRDVIDTEIVRRGRRYLLVDTAGMRRPSRIVEDVERLSVNRSISAVRRADVVVLLIEPSEGMTDQDARIATLAWEEGRALVIAMNKSDLIAPGASRERIRDEIRRDYPTLAVAPVTFLSAAREEGITGLFAAIDRADDAHDRQIRTVELNRILAEAVERRQPPTLGGARVKLYYMSQTAVRPPTFTLFANRERIPHEYARFLERHLRERIALEGTPVRVRFRRRASHGAREIG